MHIDYDIGKIYRRPLAILEYLIILQRAYYPRISEKR